MDKANLMSELNTEIVPAYTQLRYILKRKCELLKVFLNVHYIKE